MHSSYCMLLMMLQRMIQESSPSQRNDALGPLRRLLEGYETPLPTRLAPRLVVEACHTVSHVVDREYKLSSNQLLAAAPSRRVLLQLVLQAFHHLLVLLSLSSWNFGMKSFPSLGVLFSTSAQLIASHQSLKNRLLPAMPKS